jgi:hypothetical protein
MSDTTTEEPDTSTSLFSNIVNKAKYKAFKAAYDPKANEFAKEEAKRKQDDEAKKKELAKEKEDNTTTGDTTTGDTTTNDTNSDPNKFSTKRFIKNTGNQTWYYIKKGLIPFASLMLAMIVTNEMIVYSVPIRIIFFIFTFAICYIVPFYAIILTIFYIFKGGYSYYVNNMTARQKRDIMPTIFALLPVTTYKPMSSFMAFIMYPFTYPKTEQAAIKLPEIMTQYWEDLKGSFKYLDKIQNLPIFAEDLKKIKADLDNMHNLDKIQSNNVSENKINTTQETE